MYSYDYYTGEPSYDGSPPSSSQNISEQEVVSNANMMFDLDPNARYQQIQQQQRMYQQQQNPYYGYDYQQTFANQPSGFSGYAGNPAYAYLQSKNGGQQYYQQQQQPMYYRPQATDQIYHIPGYQPSGSNMLLPADAEEICNRWQIEMTKEMDLDYDKRLSQYYRVHDQQQYVYPQNNYYGQPMYSTQYYNTAIENKYMRKVEMLKEEAIQNRVDLNKHLSHLCHNYLKDGVSDEEIDRIYDGYTVVIKGTYIEDSIEYQIFADTTPYDPSAKYRKQAEEVYSGYKKYFNDNTTLAEFFEGIGQVIVDEMLAEEQCKRRDMRNISMPTATYRELVLQKANENAMRESGMMYNTPPQAPGNSPGYNIPMGDKFPVLNSVGQLLDDGELDLTAAPRWADDKKYVIKNRPEDICDIHKDEFVNSIYGLDNPYVMGGAGDGG